MSSHPSFIRTKSLICCSIFSFVFFYSSNSRTEEVDDFSEIGVAHQDATPAINKAVNLRLTDTVKALKDAGLQCSSPREKIREIVVATLDNNFSDIGKSLRERGARVNSFSKFEESFKSADVFGIRTSSQSIYAGTSTTCCIGRVNVSGVHVGIDKVDHFFGNGGILWEEYDQITTPEPQKTNAIMARNVEQEHSGWGLGNGVAGVKSYGDLAANWKGLGFYKELLDGPNPFIKCINGQFAINPARSFQMQDYIDEAWNESINCSSYLSTEAVQTVRQNIEKRGLKCPRSPETCEKLTKLYDTPLLRDNLLSPLCRNPKSDFSQVEEKGKMSWSDWRKALRGVDAGVIVDMFKPGGTK